MPMQTPAPCAVIERALSQRKAHINNRSTRRPGAQSAFHHASSKLFGRLPMPGIGWRVDFGLKAN
jgi:hypothetical protein